MSETQPRTESPSAEADFSEPKLLSIREKEYFVEYEGWLFGGMWVRGQIHSPRRATVLRQAKIAIKAGLKCVDSGIRTVWSTNRGESTVTMPAAIHLEASE